ncbi:hypothetical protein F4774DRAFT_131380 [Daldinia eschscholtzii]|nr:hypothetical protein F4774DRAFT_131380 [Daldinia eschscholtzii]
METEDRNLRIDGKAVNAAQGGISVEQQHIDQRKEHEINQNPQTNVIINNQYDRGIYERRMVPADPAASFIDQQLLRAIILAQSDDIQYDDRVGSHVHVEQAERLTEYISSLWENTSTAVDSLNQSIRKFRMDVLEPEIGDDNTPALPHKSLENSVTWVRASLACAISQSRDVYTTRRSTSMLLIDLKTHIYPYCYWVSLLRNEKKTCCLSDVFGCLISVRLGLPMISTDIH